VVTAGGIYTSPDETNWTGARIPPGSGIGPQNIPSETGIVFGNGAYLLVGNGISQSIPTNAQAMPMLNGRRVSQGFQLSALAQPNFGYRIQRCTNFTSPAWSNIYTFTSTQAVNVITDAPVGPQAYYRIVTP
jgi:hypothetical protein